MTDPYHTALKTVLTEYIGQGKVISHQDLAERAGLSNRTLDGCENIPKWRPTVATVRRLEKALPKVNGRK